MVLSKILLLIVNKKYKPKDGNYQRSKTNPAYYYWSLRSVIKKWPYWIANLLPMRFLDKSLIKWFEKGLIQIGEGVIIGKGCFIRPCMIIQNQLIVQKINIGKNVIIGDNSFISPGTQVGDNAVIAALSITKINQFIEPNSKYFGHFSETHAQEEIRSNINQNLIKRNDLPDDKFSRKTKANLIIIYTIHMTSYIIPIFFGIYYFFQLFYPCILFNLSLLEIFSNLNAFIIFLVTPLVIICLYFIHLFIIVISSKFFYKQIKRQCPPNEGVFHWYNKTKEYDYYFVRSFLLRYLKWKVQRSPYPWLLKSTYNYVGNCQIGKGVVIEDLYSAKEFLNIGDHVYIGNCLLANHLWDKSLTIKGINIENNVVISDGCSISPGTNINRDTTILPLSTTKKFTKTEPESVYYGSPINKIKDFNDLATNNEPDISGTIITTNNLYGNRFLWIFPLLIWLSLFPTFCVFLLSYKFFHDLITPIGVILILPLVVIFYFGLFLVCLLFISKLLLVFINILHKPREGSFDLDGNDKVCYFFFLRRTIKTLVFRMINHFPIPWIKIYGFRLFNIEISYSSGVLDSYIDSDFIDIGKNTILGDGSIVMSSMLIDGSLMLKKVILKDGCTVGAYSVIAPGTIIGKNTILGMGSCTKVDQKLEDGWIYVGKPAHKRQK